ncbi:P-loop containing nucleoside triphosphate hydrolase protein, partial [Mycena galericulata]
MSVSRGKPACSHSFRYYVQDFAPPQEQVPMHPVHNVQDWDAAPGAIAWPRMISFLREVKATGEIPPDHRSHDHLNEQKDIPIPVDVRDRWVSVFEGLAAKRAADGGEQIVWGLVDGFLLYWHPEVIEQLDVRIYLRVPHDALRQRRHERHGYHTAVQSDPEGTLWRDPPLYWEQIVYPAYVDANREVFENGDVEKGAATGKVKDLVLLESLEMRMGDAVDRSCEVISRFIA